jgi:hypothetical protein
LCEERLPQGTRRVLVAKLAVALFLRRIKEMRKEDTPHDESEVFCSEMRPGLLLSSTNCGFNLSVAV